MYIVIGPLPSIILPNGVDSSSLVQAVVQAMGQTKDDGGQTKDFTVRYVCRECQLPLTPLAPRNLDDGLHGDDGCYPVHRRH
jgi:hypothetical protein